VLMEKARSNKMPSRASAAAGTANALTLMAGEVHRADVERLAAQVSVEPLPARSPGFF